jgi:hypothetical protein
MPEDMSGLYERRTMGIRRVVSSQAGARPGEVARITADNFDAEAACVRLKEHKTAHKGKSRTIYLCYEAVALLLEQRAMYSTSFLFRNRFGFPQRPGTRRLRLAPGPWAAGYQLPFPASKINQDRFGRVRAGFGPFKGVESATEKNRKKTRQKPEALSNPSKECPVIPHCLVMTTSFPPLGRMG